MARLFVLVEGETEETFVNEVLAPHLYVNGFEAVSAKLMGNARLRSKRGGVRVWTHVKGDIVRHLRTDRKVIITTMVDYYGMPSDPAKQGAWPGRHQATKLRFAKKAECVESGMATDIQKELGKQWDPARFIPFVLIHEFESLLFSDCKRFASAIGRTHLAPRLHAIRQAFKSPEEINDSPSTHPSQRILDLVPDYQKPLFGNIGALEIGFEAIRAECPHFRAWLERLEALK